MEGGGTMGGKKERSVGVDVMDRKRVGGGGGERERQRKRDK